MSLLDPNPKHNRKTAIADFRCNFCPFFNICMQCIVMNSSYTIAPIATKLSQPVLNDEKSLKGVPKV